MTPLTPTFETVIVLVVLQHFNLFVCYVCLNSIYLYVVCLNSICCNVGEFNVWPLFLYRSMYAFLFVP